MPRRNNTTEQALIRAATALFCQRGYEATSIADLAAAVQLTNASIYYYVSSKQELLLRVLEDGMQGFLARLEEICAQNLASRERFRLALENHLNFIFDRPDAVAVFLRERRFLEPPYLDQYRAKVDRYDALFSGILREGVAAGEFPPVDPKIASVTVLGMINWLIEWYRPEGRLNRAEVSGIMMDLILERLLGLDARPVCDGVESRL